MGERAIDTFEIDHPEVKPMSGEAREAYKRDCGEYSLSRCIATYRDSTAEIFIVKIETPETGAVALSHEFMHHILAEFEGEETSRKFDTGGLGYYLDKYLFPDIQTDCGLCEHYTPSTMFADEGYCAKHKWNTRVWHHCPDCELSSVFKKLPFTEYETWADYRRGNFGKLLGLAKSKNMEVAEHCRKEFEKWRKYVQEHSSQFELECKHLATDCFPHSCRKEYCSRFQKSKGLSTASQC